MDVQRDLQRRRFFLEVSGGTAELVYPRRPGPLNRQGLTQDERFAGLGFAVALLD